MGMFLYCVVGLGDAALQIRFLLSGMLSEDVVNWEYSRILAAS